MFRPAEVAKAESRHATAPVWTHWKTGLLSRRDVLITAAAAGAAAALRPWTTVLTSASQPRTPVNFGVPAGSCDCQAHIFGDSRRFPFWSSRTYTLEPASVEEIRVLHRALHTDRVVVVNPSVYGTDNSCTLGPVGNSAERSGHCGYR